MIAETAIIMGTAMARKQPNGQAPRSAAALAVSNLSGKHRKTLDAIFARPDKSNISWSSFVGLMEALGADVITEGGSAHDFRLFGDFVNIHRPHPGHELYKPYVRAIRSFLKRVGVTP